MSEVIVQTRGSGREPPGERAEVDAEAEAVLREYESSDVTMRELAERYGVGLWVIDRRLRRARKRGAER